MDQPTTINEMLRDLIKSLEKVNDIKIRTKYLKFILCVHAAFVRLVIIPKNMELLGDEFTPKALEGDIFCRLHSFWLAGSTHIPLDTIKHPGLIRALLVFCQQIQTNPNTFNHNGFIDDLIATFDDESYVLAAQALKLIEDRIIITKQSKIKLFYGEKR